MLNPPKITLRASYLLFLIPLIISFKCVKQPTVYMYEVLDMNLSNVNTSGGSPVVVGSSVLKHIYAMQLRLSITPGKTNHKYQSHKNEDTVTDFSITSSEVFNGIAPGTTLNHLFSFRKNANQFIAITSESFTQIFSISDEHTTDNYLVLANPPDADGNYTFHLSATFSDGRILTDSIFVNLHE